MPVRDRLPQGPEWECELKFDGYRALAIKTGRRVLLIVAQRARFRAVVPRPCASLRDAAAGDHP
jgi:hypothetical protein